MSEDDRGVYARQGFAQPVGLGRAPALLLVDFQVAFVDPQAFGGGNIPAAAKHSVALPPPRAIAAGRSRIPASSMRPMGRTLAPSRARCRACSR